MRNSPTVKSTRPDYDSAYTDLQTALALELDGKRNRAREQGPRQVDGAGGAVLLPAASLALYFYVGEYRVVQNPRLAQASPPGQTTRRHRK